MRKFQENLRKRIFVVTFSIIIVVFGCVIGIVWYKSYRINRWINVNQSSEEWVEVKGQAAIGKAPIPDMKLIDGKVKFIINDSNNEVLHLGYLVIIKIEPATYEKNLEEYKKYTYQVEFKYTLFDKDGFKTLEVTGPLEQEILIFSKTQRFQNICKDNITPYQGRKTESVQVGYIITATPVMMLQEKK